jgi:outer membrane protein TolC
MKLAEAELLSSNGPDRRHPLEREEEAMPLRAGAKVIFQNPSVAAALYGVDVAQLQVKIAEGASGRRWRCKAACSSKIIRTS